MKQLPVLRIIVILLALEKVAQHGLTALFFVLGVPGDSPPGLGPFIEIDVGAMAIANALLAAAFAAALRAYAGRWRLSPWWIIALAVLDIALEFAFHGLFYSTLSVIVSGALILAAGLEHWLGRKNRNGAG